MIVGENGIGGIGVWIRSVVGWRSDGLGDTQYTVLLI